MFYILFQSGLAGISLANPCDIDWTSLDLIRILSAVLQCLDPAVQPLVSAVIC